MAYRPLSPPSFHSTPFSKTVKINLIFFRCRDKYRQLSEVFQLSATPLRSSIVCLSARSSKYVWTFAMFTFYQSAKRGGFPENHPFMWANMVLWSYNEPLCAKMIVVKMLFLWKGGETVPGCWNPVLSSNHEGGIFAACTDLSGNCEKKKLISGGGS